MKSLSIWIATLTIGLSALACDNATTPTTPDTGGTVWELQSLETPAGVVVVPDPARYTLELRDDGNAHVVADCNICNGPYELEGNNLSMGLMACTLAACAPNSLHNDYLAALGGVTTWQSSGGELTLAYDGGRLVFR